jgi:hypothetical protein
VQEEEKKDNEVEEVEPQAKEIVSVRNGGPSTNK